MSKRRQPERPALRLVNGTVDDFAQKIRTLPARTPEQREAFLIRCGSHRQCPKCGGVKKRKKFQGVTICEPCRRPWRIKHPKITNKQGYAKYLESVHWQEKRQEYWSSNRPKGCYVCFGKARDLHHRTYERLGRELLTDLVAVCRECHEAIHVYHNLHRDLSLWDATRAVRTEVNKERQAEDSRG